MPFVENEEASESVISYSDLLDKLPKQGLFRGEKLPFLLSPTPLLLEPPLRRQLERLGPILLKFQMACDRLYRRSKKGTITPWIYQTLDAGKPTWLLDAQDSALYKRALPRVIRPDLLLTPRGFSMTELDSVPGGMGLTAWLSQQYPDVLGEGMIDGFRSILPSGGQIHYSEECLDYAPEMAWLIEQLNTTQAPSNAHKWQLKPAEKASQFSQVYRFFELFDWKNLPHIKVFLEHEITPPLKPHLEEKLWLAFFHAPGLQCYWKEELRGKQLKILKDIIPYGSVVDPTPLPPHATLPKLNANSWEQVAAFSQRERELVLKVSGFSELAWGSRGVTIGHDINQMQWQSTLDKAQAQFTHSPCIIQEFTETNLVEHPYFDPETGAVRLMKGRVRLCPYYFVSSDYKHTTLGGVLATINPADKKKIHGMRDAILTVASN